MTNTLTEAEMTNVQDIVMEQLDVKREQITPEALIVEDLCADSLDVMEISMKLEETFGFTIGDEQLDRIKTMDDLYEAVGNLLPEQKVAAVQALMKAGERVLMAGDGTNDAPALSSATVGIALASGGGGISAEAADAVILADDPTRIAEALAISRRTMRIARESIWVGLGLSGVAMGFAALGLIPPTIGALLQEAVDVAVILNALRASAVPRSRKLQTF